MSEDRRDMTLIEEIENINEALKNGWEPESAPLDEVIARLRQARGI